MTHEWLWRIFVLRNTMGHSVPHEWLWGIFLLKAPWVSQYHTSGWEGFSFFQPSGLLTTPRVAERDFPSQQPWVVYFPRFTVCKFFSGRLWRLNIWPFTLVKTHEVRQWNLPSTTIRGPTIRGLSWEAVSPRRLLIQEKETKKLEPTLEKGSRVSKMEIVVINIFEMRLGMQIYGENRIDLSDFGTI